MSRHLGLLLLTLPLLFLACDDDHGGGTAGPRYVRSLTMDALHTVEFTPAGNLALFGEALVLEDGALTHSQPLFAELSASGTLLARRPIDSARAAWVLAVAPADGGFTLFCQGDLDTDGGHDTLFWPFTLAHVDARGQFLSRDSVDLPLTSSISYSMPTVFAARDGGFWVNLAQSVHAVFHVAADGRAAPPLALDSLAGSVTDVLMTDDGGLLLLTTRCVGDSLNPWVSRCGSRLAKFTAGGLREWTCELTPPGRERVYSRIARDGSGALWLGGYARASNAPERVTLLKLSATGDSLWGHALDVDAPTAVSGLAVTPTGDLVLLLNWRQHGDVWQSGPAAVLRLSAAGELRWQRWLPAKNGVSAFGLRLLDDGSAVFCTRSNFFGPYAVARINSDGQMLWSWNAAFNF